MEAITEIVKISIPAALVLYGMYLTAKSFLSKEFNAKLVQLRIDRQKEIIPLRLQAYERTILLLERTSLPNLIVRLDDQNYNVAFFRGLLIETIRAEYGHNISQQIYMSEEAWNLVKQAIEETISEINIAAEQLSPEAPSQQLAKLLLERKMNASYDFIEKAQQFIKEEVKSLF